MIRLGLGRGPVAAVLLALCFFGVGVREAFATHYRYGNIYWERVLTHNVPGEAKYRVTFEGGWRWSFPWAVTSGTWGCPASGFTATGGTGTGSCPSINTVVNPGTIATDRVVKFNTATTFTTTQLTYAAKVNAINSNKDLVYTTFSFDVIVQTGAATTLTFTSAARLSTLMDGNQDSTWRLSVKLDPSSTATKSPKSVSIPSLTISRGVDNTIDLPTLAFDNFSNRIRAATALESGLIAIQPQPSLPGSFTIDSAQSRIHFTPATNPAPPGGSLTSALYAVQFIIESFDPATPAVVKAAVPVELIFESIPNNTTTFASLSTPLSEVFFPLSTATQFNMTASLSGPGVGNPTTWFGTINATPVPVTGTASYTVPTAGMATALVVGAVIWTPDLTSSATTMCFQAVYTQPSTGAQVVSPGMVCVDMNLNPFATTLSQLLTPSSSQVGNTIPVSVKANRTLDNQIIVQRQVTFELIGPNGGITTATGITDVTGVASVNLPVIEAGANKVRATFNAVAGQYLQSQIESGTITVSKGNAVLAVPALPVLASVGIPSPIRVRLTAHPGGGPAVNAAVEFHITGPEGPATLIGTTDATGFATVNYTPLTSAGGYQVFARFDGDDNLNGGVQSSSTAFSTYQRLQLTLDPIVGVANSAAPVTGTLLMYPQGTAVPSTSFSVQIAFSGGPAVQNILSGGTGVFSTTATWGATGNYAATASLPMSGLFANSGGLLTPETAGTTVNIGTANSSLAALTLPGAGLVGTSVAVSTTLTRTTAPAGPLTGATVTFRLTSPSGTITNLNATTQANGTASATFSAALFAARGNYSVSASYAGGGGINSSSLANVTLPVYQRTQLTMTQTTVTGLAGSAVAIGATLTTIPTVAPLVGASVTFDFGGAIPPVTVSTGTAGAASTSVTFPAGGTFTVTASFIDAGGFYTNDAGAFPVAAETATATATINKANMSLTTPSLTGTSVPGGTLFAQSTLTRAPGVAQSGQPVSFTVTGAFTATSNGMTNGSGVAAVAIPQTARGVITVQSSFAGTPQLNSANSLTATRTIVQPAFLTVAPVTAIAGGTAVLSATLREVGTNNPIAGQVVLFTSAVPGGPAGVGATTDALGVASMTVAFPSAENGSFTALFQNTADFFVDHLGLPQVETATASVNVSSAQSALAPLTVASTASVGESLTVSTVLTRTSSPAGTVPGATVPFTLGGASTQVLQANTDQNGLASVTFTLGARGSHTVVAAYAGNSALTPASSNTANVGVYQRTQLQIAPASGVAGAATTVSAALTTSPAGDPISGQTITFTYGVYSASAVTNASGVATASIVFNEGGTFSGSASFLNTAAFYADPTGAQVATTATGSATITNAATALSALTVPASALVGNSLSVSTALTRTSAPSGPLTGATVTFTLTDAEGTQTASAVTSPMGVASVSFPLTARGAYTVKATFGGGGGLEPSASNTANVAVYQRTQLSLASQTAPAGLSTPVSATLLALPGAGPVAGQTVSFSFGGAIPNVTAVTNAAGIATVDVTFPNAGTFTATASFGNPAGYFVDENGLQLPSISTAVVTVTDSTPPVITPTVTGTQVNGWYNGAVSISWSVTDAQSTVTGQTGCDTISVTTEGDALTFTCSASSDGGPASKSVTIKRDVTNPIVTVPAAQTLEATSAAGASAAYPAATAADATSGTGAVTCSPAVGATLPLGDSTITCSVSDLAGNGGSASFTVSVVDTTAPSVAAASNVSTPATSPAGAVVTFAAAAYTDAVAGTGTTVCAPASGATFALGTHTVTCSKTDAAGNTGSTSFTVTVTNNPPTFTPPANISVAGTSAAGAVVTFTANGGDVEQITIPAVCTPPSGSTFPYGTTAVNCLVTDVAGATAGGSFTVTVSTTFASFQAVLVQLLGDSNLLNSLQVKINAAAKAANASARAGSLNAFVNEVNAQTGKKITAAQAAVLLQLVQSLY